MPDPTETTSAELTAQQRFKGTTRNDSCPCGSGLKYKKCHLAADEASERARLLELQKQSEAARAAEEAAAAESEGDTSEAGLLAKKKALPANPGKTKRGGQSAVKGQERSTRPNNLPRRKAV